MSHNFRSDNILLAFHWHNTPALGGCQEVLPDGSDD
jgi:hypothetical protein